MKRLLVAVASLGLAACSMLPGAASGAGYSEEMIAANRYRISYTGPEDAKASLIADRTLARAAQVTLDKGNEWFEVASRVNGDHSQTLVIVMGKGETLAGGPQTHDAKATLNRLRDRIS
jgi:hypothetical protein